MTLVRMVKLSKKGQFVIPKEVRKALGVKEGDGLLLTLEEGRVTLANPARHAKAVRGAFKGTWGSSGASSPVTWSWWKGGPLARSC